MTDSLQISDSRQKILALMTKLYPSKNELYFNQVFAQVIISDDIVFHEQIKKLLETWMPRRLSDTAESTWQSRSTTAHEIQPLIATNLSQPYFLAVLANDQSYFEKNSSNLTPILKKKSAILACLLGNEEMAQYLFTHAQINPAEDKDIFTYVAFSDNPHWIKSLMKTYHVKANELPSACINALSNSCFELYEALENFSTHSNTMA